MSFTDRRKKQFASQVSKYASKLGFVDVGSGGLLKAPWNLLPSNWVWKTDFEPTEERDHLICLSNCKKWTEFYVARDERASSLHETNPEFIERFSFDSLASQKTINVECVTLDEVLVNDYQKIDAVDINVEGHDYQVLQGGRQLLANGFIKLIKIEFELAQVWKGQGWFSDIDPFLRSFSYELVDMDVEYARPYKARHIFHRGEPVWGKAFYVLSDGAWLKKLLALNRKEIKDHALKGMALYVLADLPARALTLLDHPTVAECLTKVQIRTLRKKILETFRFSKADRLLGGLGSFQKLFNRK